MTAYFGGRVGYGTVLLGVFVFLVATTPVGSGMATAGQSSADSGAALRAAASLGDVETVRSLIAGGADVDAANDYGATPLILASMRGRTEVARVLLEAGADAELADGFYGRSPLGWATEGGFREIVSLLFAGGVGGFDQLFAEAVNAGDAERVAQLLELHVPPAEALSAALESAMATRNEALGQLLMSVGAVPPPPEIIAIDVETLRLYQGNYVDEVGFELTVVADEQTRTLLVRPPGVRNPLRFLPVQQAMFISEQSESIYVRFTVRDGRVVSMSFTQAGATRRMTKR
jgi:hypothetical protein